ncbi:hypothetical protein [Streptomyces werraensis]|uniref:hypothetical protein n=1 Tax=Streptomyces werraensis TaxID=68284 RepID=UPI0037CEF6D1
MTIQIAPEVALILLIGCIVGLVVYRHTTQPHTGASTRGDLVGAIGAAVGIITVLTLLLGVEGAAETAKTPDPASGPTTTGSSEPQLP